LSIVGSTKSSMLPSFAPANYRPEAALAKRRKRLARK
jgi:hypothetical protein